MRQTSTLARMLKPSGAADRSSSSTPLRIWLAVCRRFFFFTMPSIYHHACNDGDSRDGSILIRMVPPCTSAELARERLQQANEGRRRFGFHPYEHDFRSHYYLTYLTAPHSNEPYERYASAYCYGYRLVYDREYRGKDWATIAARARHRWEHEEEQPWDAVADAVSYGFSTGRDHERSWEAQADS
jgi:hypothetical protein